jgi:hypothetical protein
VVEHYTRDVEVKQKYTASQMVIRNNKAMFIAGGKAYDSLM